MYASCIGWGGNLTKTICFFLSVSVSDLSVPPLVHEPCRAAMDRPHPLHRPHLRVRVLAQPPLLQRQALLRVQQRRQGLL